eukprot:5676321-Amphidinium_carterae.1
MQPHRDLQNLGFQFCVGVHHAQNIEQLGVLLVVLLLLEVDACSFSSSQGAVGLEGSGVDETIHERVLSSHLLLTLKAVEGTGTWSRRSSTPRLGLCKSRIPNKLQQWLFFRSPHLVVDHHVHYLNSLVYSYKKKLSVSANSCHLGYLTCMSSLTSFAQRIVVDPRFAASYSYK